MRKYNLFKTKKETNRPDVCLSLSLKNTADLYDEISKYGDKCQIIEWCVDGFEGAENFSKEEFIEKAKLVKSFIKPRKMLVDYKGDEVIQNRIIRWAMGIADIVDIDFGNPQIDRLVREAKRKDTKVLVSHHEFERMPEKNEIAELYIRMEKTGGDILKIAAMSKNEEETYRILEGAAAYKQLKHSKDIVAIAMGEEGQVSRICAGDFGSVISYARGSVPTAPGQIECDKLSKYMDTYYSEEEE